MICEKIQEVAVSSRCSNKSYSSRQIPPRIVPSTSFPSTADFLTEFRKYETREVKVTLAGFVCRLCDTFRASLRQSLDFHVKNEHSCDKLLKPLNGGDPNSVTLPENVHSSEAASDTSLLAATSPVTLGELNDDSLSVTSLANVRVGQIDDPVVISLQKLVQVKSRLQALN